jgi:hypothetical protein
VRERNAYMQPLLGLVAARRTAEEEARTTVIARGRERETRFPRLGLVARQEGATIQHTLCNYWSFKIETVWGNPGSTDLIGSCCTLMYRLLVNVPLNLCC